MFAPAIRSVRVLAFFVATPASHSSSIHGGADDWNVSVSAPILSPRIVCRRVVALAKLPPIPPRQYGSGWRAAEDGQPSPRNERDVRQRRRFRIEWAPRGIAVNCVAPGLIAAGMTLGVLKDFQEAGVARTPMKRNGTAEEVAYAIAFFTSPQASFVTGQTLFVCGGLSIGFSRYSGRRTQNPHLNPAGRQAGPGFLRGTLPCPGRGSAAGQAPPGMGFMK